MPTVVGQDSMDKWCGRDFYILPHQYPWVRVEAPHLASPSWTQAWCLWLCQLQPPARKFAPSPPLTAKSVRITRRPCSKVNVTSVRHGRAPFHSISPFLPPSFTDEQKTQEGHRGSDWIVRSRILECSRIPGSFTVDACQSLSCGRHCPPPLLWVSASDPRRGLFLFSKSLFTISSDFRMTLRHNNLRFKAILMKFN